MGLFSASARENITYGGDEEYALKNDGTYERTVTASRDEDIWEAAEEASARDFIETLPDKLETHVTDRILSGGQRQRLALARAFLRRPTLLVLGKDKEKGKKTGGMGRFGILLEDDTDTGEGREDDDEEEAK